MTGKPIVRKGYGKNNRPMRKTEDDLKGRLRVHRLNEGLPTLPELEMELQGYYDVLLGRVMPPHDLGVLTLMETADSYFARASELTGLIQAGEREGWVLKNSAHYKFRTGELRTFMDMAKRAADLGSRRLSEDQLEFERQKLGREAR